MTTKNEQIKQLSRQGEMDGEETLGLELRRKRPHKYWVVPDYLPTTADLNQTGPEKCGQNKTAGKIKIRLSSRLYNQAPEIVQMSKI